MSNFVNCSTNSPNSTKYENYRIEQSPGAWLNMVRLDSSSPGSLYSWSNSPGNFAKNELLSVLLSPSMATISPIFIRSPICNETMKYHNGDSGSTNLGETLNFSNDSHLGDQSKTDKTIVSESEQSDARSIDLAVVDPYSEYISNSEAFNPCNCKKSKCLKLYCDCFAALRYCKGCNCHGCNNIEEFEIPRLQAIDAITSRDCNAFLSKVAVKDSNLISCKCKQSRCLKKYCECFHANAFCGLNCKCLTCANMEGSELLATTRANLEKQEGASAQKAEKKRRESPSSIAEFSKKMSPGNSLDTIGTPNSCFHSPVKSQPGSTNSINSSDGNGSLIYSVHQINNLNSLTVTACPDGSGYIPPQEYINSSMTNCVVIDRSGNTLIPVHSISLEPFTNSNSQSFQSSALFLGRPSGSSWGLPPPTPVKVLDANQKTPRSYVPDLMPSSLSSSLNIRSNLNLDIRSKEKDSRKKPSHVNKKRTRFAPTTVVYPFFGMTNPMFPKIIALRCLEYLGGKDFYSMSVVNTIWCRAAMDEALWE